MLAWKLLLMLTACSLLGIEHAQSCQHLSVLEWFAYEYWVPHEKLTELAATYCEYFKAIYEEKEMADDLVRLGDSEACMSSIKYYFESIYFDSKDIVDMGKLASTCVDAHLTEIECSNLVHFMRQFCWTMSGVATYIKLVKDTNVDLRNLSRRPKRFLNYDMYLELEDITELNVGMCIKSGRFNSAEDLAAISSYLGIYKSLVAWSGQSIKFTCDCHEVLAVAPYFSMWTFKQFVSDNKPMSPALLLQQVCTNSQKKHHWSESQLKVMTDKDTLRTVDDLQGDAIKVFFLEAGPICESDWQRQTAHANWPLRGVMIALGLNLPIINHLDKVRMEIVHKAINLAMPFLTYCQFLWSLDAVSEVNDWNCKKSLFEAVLTEQDSANHWAKHLDRLKDHMDLLLSIPSGSEKSICSTLAIQIAQVETTYYQTNQWNAQILERMLNAALDNDRTLAYTSNCLILISTIEAQIPAQDLGQYNADMINRRLDAFRQNIFAKPTEFCLHDVSEYTSNVQLMVSTFFVTDETVIFPSPSPST